MIGCVIGTSMTPSLTVERAVMRVRGSPVGACKHVAPAGTGWPSHTAVQRGR